MTFLASQRIHVIDHLLLTIHLQGLEYALTRLDSRNIPAQIQGRRAFSTSFKTLNMINVINMSPAAAEAHHPVMAKYSLHT